ncbi:MAG: hypothetical protein WC812_02675 [Candidatus Pacearchaeota archaeon]|jgi:hypothetical protein
MDENKHPENFDEYSPKEFAEKFFKTNYFYQLEVYKCLEKLYLKETQDDLKRPSRKKLGEGRIQLSSGLEKLSLAIKDPVLKAMNLICNSCKKYMKNPYEKD